MKSSAARSVERQNVGWPKSIHSEAALRFHVRRRKPDRKPLPKVFKDRSALPPPGPPGNDYGVDFVGLRTVPGLLSSRLSRESPARFEAKRDRGEVQGTTGIRNCRTADSSLLTHEPPWLSCRIEDRAQRLSPAGSSALKVWVARHDSSPTASVPPQPTAQLLSPLIRRLP